MNIETTILYRPAGPKEPAPIAAMPQRFGGELRLNRMDRR